MFHRARCLLLPRSVWLSLVLAFVLAAPASAEVDLLGTWFVVIHYTDSMTANPTAARWEDKVWTIEKKGSRLQWSEYPIVVFNDGSGRFGRVGGNPRARLLVHWQPNANQMEEILVGPQVNSRGSKKKTLRGSPKRGYSSSSQSRSVSAMTVGYQETWQIQKPTTLPVFVRDDSLGTESSLATKSDDVISGRTRYATLRVSEDGNTLTGEYARDENKKGTFKLIRAGAARGIQSDGRTPNQKAADRARNQFRQAAGEVGYQEFLKTLDDDVKTQVGDAKLKQIWGDYEQRIMSGDAGARSEIGDAVRKAYMESAEQ